MSILIQTMRAIAVASALSTVAFTALTIPAFAVEEVNTKTGPVLHGYDPVAYFMDGKPVKGDTKFSADYEGGTYHFASAAHRDAFQADPSHFAPQFGGFCAYGAALGRKFDVDPEAWKIVDGKLYVNLNKKVFATWNENIPGYLRGANANWTLIQHVADADLEKAKPAGVVEGAR